MSAIIVENLGKRYRIGHQIRHNTLRDALVHKLDRLSPFGNRRPRADQEDFWALNDVSFEVRPGEVVGIVGRNGAGKSTLLKVLSRITEPTTGKVRLKGRVASLLEVGTGFHPELSGRENIFLNGAILGMPRSEIRRKFDEIVAFAEVDRFLDTPVKRYSSGMYVRLAFAVAAHLEPEILIVDEVLAVGDAQFQKKCLGKMREVSSGQGRTILFVSHNMGAVRQLCGRCLLMEQGALKRDGLTPEILADFEGSNTKTDFVLDAPIEALPGLTVRHASARCTNNADSPWSTLLVNASGRMDGRVARYGFGIQITGPDGVMISRIGARLINGYVDGRDGDWGIRLEAPAINRVLAGGRYHINILVNEAMSAGKPLTPAPLTVDIPEADPYGAGVNFTGNANGLLALAIALTETSAHPASSDASAPSSP